jgi:hypothetical protein
MTVPPMAGWEDILTLLVLVVGVAVAFLLVGAVWAAVSARSEWQAWLDARSSTARDATPEPADRPGELLRADRGR